MDDELLRTPPVSASSVKGSAVKSWLPWRRQTPSTPSTPDIKPLSFDTPKSPSPPSLLVGGGGSPKSLVLPSPLSPPPLPELVESYPHLDKFAMEIQKLISTNNLDGVLALLDTEYRQLELPKTPDVRFISVLLDVLCFLADHEQEDVSGLRRWLDVLGDLAQNKQTPNSTFLRGIDCTVLVRLLCVNQTAIRSCTFGLFSKLFTPTKPWSLAHREKRLGFAEAFFVSIPGPLSSEWCEALELFLMTSLLNSSLGGEEEDLALQYFEREGGYELVLQRVENPDTSPELVSALIDLLRGLTYLGGPPKDFYDAYQLSLEENNLEAVSEAKNPASFTCVCRLVSKMLEQPTFPSVIRLPLLHSIMSVFEANPKNFGILERRFQLLSQLSRHLGVENLHDELLFMCVKLFELVGLGFEYRPISAVTALCEPGVLPAIAKRQDERTFGVLTNTLCKLVSRHPSLAADSGLLKNVVFPAIQSPISTSRAILTSCLALLTACVERHATNCSQGTKPAVFENNCALVRQANLGLACKDVVLGFPNDPVLANSALHVISVLAKDVNGDLQLMLELLQSRSTVLFRITLFEHCLEAIAHHDLNGGSGGDIWSASGVAMFDCVLTVLLSLESAFVSPTMDGDDKEFILLQRSLVFLHESFMHGNAVDFDSLFPVLNLSGILQSNRAEEFVKFVYGEIIVQGNEIENSEPMVLLGCLSPPDHGNRGGNNHLANLMALTMLRDLVAHDGESSCWNRQQVAKIRGAERLVHAFAIELQSPEHELHQVLVQIVGCVGNFAATPELLDLLLRLAYRAAPNDLEEDQSTMEGEQEKNGEKLVQATSVNSVPLECVLEVLKLVAEPKIVGRHVVLNAKGARADLVPFLSNKTWPPISTSSHIETGYSLSTWFSLSATANSKQKTLFTMYSSSVLLLAVVLERMEEDGDMESSLAMSEGMSSMGLGIAKHSLVVNTSSAQVRLLGNGEELFPGRWHHLVLVHKKTPSKSGGLASFWKGGGPAASTTFNASESLEKGGQGILDLYLNGEKLESIGLPWPNQVESSFVVKLGWEEERLLMGRTLLFEGGLKPETIAGLFLRGPSYRGSLNKANPLFQDKKAVITSAFERMHFLARDDDFFNRMELSGWMDIQRFVSAALGARADPKLVSLVFQFDPEDDDDGGGMEFRILPQPIQETLCSFGGASVALFPLLLRVGRNLDQSALACSVLVLLRDSLRGSDRARFLFRFDDGHRVLAWLLHLICQNKTVLQRSEVFRSALMLSTIGTGFDSTLIDAESLFLINMNDHVWRNASTGATAWDLVAELLPWLGKLLHLNNRHRLVNFAVLQTIHVFDWVFGLLVSLVGEPEHGSLARKQALEILTLVSSLLELLLRCDLTFVSGVFEFVLATLGREEGAGENDTLLLLDPLLQKSAGGFDLPSTSSSSSPTCRSRRVVSLGNVRCCLLDLLIRLREPRARASSQECLDHAQVINNLYIKHAAGGWIWSILEFASRDFDSVLHVLAFCESEALHHTEFKLMLLASKSLCRLAELLSAGEDGFANRTEVVLFWARLCTGCLGGAVGKEDLPLALHDVLALPHFGKFASLADVAFAGSAFEGLCAWLQYNMTTASVESITVNAHVFRFLWKCSQASTGLTKLWSTQANIRVLNRALFTHEQFAASVQGVDEPFGPFEFLLDLIVWSPSPSETFNLACALYPETASPEQVQTLQLKVFLGCLDHAQLNAELARAMIHRCCLGWVPSTELFALQLANKWEDYSPALPVHSLVLCILDRQMTGEEEEVEILAKIRGMLPSLFMVGDAEAFVACLVRCIFPHAIQQATLAMQGHHAEEREFAWWTLFISLCRLVPDSVRKLITVSGTGDADVIRAQELASTGLTPETKMDWILAHLSGSGQLKQLLVQTCNAVWSREMDSKLGKWHVSGRASLSLSPTAVLLGLMDMNARTVAITAAATNSGSMPTSGSSLGTGRILGWGSSTAAASAATGSSSFTPRAKAEGFFQPQQDHSQLVSKARNASFVRLEQLFSSKFEDLLRGEKSWHKAWRRSVLPNLPWEPNGGRNLELEAEKQRWKLDPFEDPLRQRRRLRVNHTFYKRYNLTALKPAKSPKIVASTQSRKRALSSPPVTPPHAGNNPPIPDEEGVMLRHFDSVGDAAATSPGIILALKRRPSGHQPSSLLEEDATTTSRVRTQTLLDEPTYPTATGGEDDEDDLATLDSESYAQEDDDEDEPQGVEEESSNFFAEKDDFVLVPDQAAVALHANLERVRSAMDPMDWETDGMRLNCSTVRGLEERMGLCVIARTSLYVLDNYQVVDGEGIVQVDEKKSRFNIQVRTSTVPLVSALTAQDGEEEDDEPTSVSVPITAAAVAVGNKPGPSHRSRRVRHDEILDVFRRRFLFRDVGLEIFSSNGATLFVVFASTKDRDRVQTELKKARRKASQDLPFHDILTPPKPTLQEAKRLWVQGQMSNFDYLMLLNTLAGRSFNDPAQYLVFPWVLRDYESAKLDLTNPESFRDLSKPMGAMTPERVAYAMDRYTHLDTEADTNHLPAFHFGSHYSCSGYVANYLFRQEPFSRMALQLQGGGFDHPDRLFRSVEQTWKSASGASMQDVRELVPEFFTSHEFLLNLNQFELGSTHRGVVVNDVELPRWALGSPLEFIRLHRKALESRQVSEHLNEWIDLVFGYKQRGREAIKAVNVFHPLTYEGEVDLDAIKDPTERASAMEQIHSFGQTPKRLFDSGAHPKREHFYSVAPLIVAGLQDRIGVVTGVQTACALEGSSTFTAGECQLVLVADELDSLLPPVQYASSGPTVHEMMWDDLDRLVVLRGRGGGTTTRRHTSLITPNRYVSFGDRDGSLRVHSCYVSANQQSHAINAGGLDSVLVAFEDLHRGRIHCVAVVDFGKLLVTGGADGAVSVWRLRKNQDNNYRLEHEATNVGHHASASVLCICVCKEQGIAVSGATDGTAAVWDWGKRQEFIRQLKGHGKPIRFVGVNARNGNIITVCEREARVWHVNGQLLATSAEFRNLRLSLPTASAVVPCHSHVPGIVLALGHSNGEVSLWDLAYPSDLGKATATKLELRAVLPGSDSVVCLAVSKDGRMLAAGTIKGEVKRWCVGDTLMKRFKQQQSSSAVLAAQTIKTLVSRNSSVLGGDGA
ncbi:hypothetical protein BASA81_007557 [Batrachochytrium salamandrivorans]|nr:hypothetical protein BASA81_007557 [Batrachochytrium salamandrivorans]